MAAFNKFNSWIGYVCDGKINHSSDAFKIMLTNTAPVATNAVYADVSGTELANGNGYTTGGSAVGTDSDTDTSGTVKFIASGDNLFTATGSMGPFRYAIIYDTTPSTPLKPLMGYWDYGSNITLATSETFNVDLDQVNGIAQYS